MPEEEGYWIRLLNRAGGKGVVSMEMIILKKVLDVGEERILFFFFFRGKGGAIYINNETLHKCRGEQEGIVKTLGMSQSRVSYAWESQRRQLLSKRFQRV